ncbi:MULTISPECIES: DUF1819 family protein [unclassified Microbacterium]|uniref:DUF1819 family protein n=1 Tax=unclassified Microbacterium TaxID=2609290 RepID=UPI00214C4376|nr:MULTISPECIES: DUF1819 family protein [unclassified Microbacterium]MCR2784130.1 DUF1819 family protein [Microbacterium sp. zg.B96]WIM15034.1 DUF1819 family protein [Microbacterium sp. zg-B96]
MSATRDHSQRYKLSFTTGRLFLQNASLAAEIYGRLHDWREVREAINSDNLLQSRAARSATRMGGELIQRLQELTDSEIALLAVVTGEERAHLMWVATCRRYSLIGEFAEEVLRERFLQLAADVLPEHFDSFIRGKALWHEELSEVTPKTLQKLRSTVFLLMRDAGLTDNDFRIVPTVLSTRVHDELAKRTPNDVRFFPTREAA